MRQLKTETERQRRRQTDRPRVIEREMMIIIMINNMNTFFLYEGKKAKRANSFFPIRPSPKISGLN